MIVYLFRWKLPGALGGMECTDLLRDHGTEASKVRTCQPTNRTRTNDNDPVTTLIVYVYSPSEIPVSRNALRTWTACATSSR